jgi:hypothetical protein
MKHAEVGLFSVGALLTRLLLSKSADLEEGHVAWACAWAQHPGSTSTAGNSNSAFGPREPERARARHSKARLCISPVYISCGGAWCYTCTSCQLRAVLGAGATAAPPPHKQSTHKKQALAAARPPPAPPRAGEEGLPPRNAQPPSPCRSTSTSPASSFFSNPCLCLAWRPYLYVNRIGCRRVGSHNFPHHDITGQRVFERTSFVKGQLWASLRALDGCSIKPVNACLVLPHFEN